MGPGRGSSMSSARRRSQRAVAAPSALRLSDRRAGGSLPRSDRPHQRLERTSVWRRRARTREQAAVGGAAGVGGARGGRAAGAAAPGRRPVYRSASSRARTSAGQAAPGIHSTSRRRVVARRPRPRRRAGGRSPTDGSVVHAGGELGPARRGSPNEGDRQPPASGQSPERIGSIPTSERAVEAAHALNDGSTGRGGAAGPSRPAPARRFPAAPVQLDARAGDPSRRGAESSTQPSPLLRRARGPPIAQGTSMARSRPRVA